MATGFIKIKNLDRNGLQTRAALNEATVTEYTEAMDAGVEFPPVTVFRDNEGVYRLADGFHRVEAKTRTAKYGKPGFDTVKATIINGGYSDALKFALGANAAHGLRRTNADKRHALEMAWDKRMELFGGEPSNGALAKMCGVSERTVVSFRADHPAPVTRTIPVRQDNRNVMPPTPPPMKRVGVDGVARAVPVRPAPVRPPVKKGYHIGPDGKQHADGVALDRFGVEIPERIRTAFTSDTISEIVSALQRARTTLAQAIRSKDPSVAAVAQRAGLEMENAYHELKAAKPYCVCRMCQGQGCEACRENGFQTEDQFNRNPPEFRP